MRSLTAIVLLAQFLHSSAAVLGKREGADLSLNKPISFSTSVLN
jgi:hypothetical protein